MLVLTSGRSFHDAGMSLFILDDSLTFTGRDRQMLRLAPLIFRNLLRNRRRSLLTLASTAMSLGILALLFAIYQSFFHGDDTSPSSALRIACQHKVSLTQQLPASYEAKILSIDGVEKVSTWSWFGGLFKNDSKNFFGRFAVDADSILDIYKDWKVPPEQVTAFKQMRSGCLVATKTATKYGIKVGDKVEIVGRYLPRNPRPHLRGDFGQPPQ